MEHTNKHDEARDVTTPSRRALAIGFAIVLAYGGWLYWGGYGPVGRPIAVVVAASLVGAPVGIGLSYVKR